MKSFDSSLLKKLYKPPSSSHKGDNGKVLVIGGSKLFHAASLWSLSVASKIVDMVFYASVPENNKIVQRAKEEFRNGIVIPRKYIKDYMQEADCVLIGPGLPREEGVESGDDDTKTLTEHLLKTCPDKKWLIDGGSLQVISPDILPKNAIITPHHKEFAKISNSKYPISNSQLDRLLKEFAKEYRVVVLLKGETDIVASPTQIVEIPGGNAGMTKGGTGDVLAGLTAALYAQNKDPFLSACAASYINKRAGESLFKKVGYYFNASDLVEEIPKVMKKSYSLIILRACREVMSSPTRSGIQNLDSRFHGNDRRVSSRFHSNNILRLSIIKFMSDYSMKTIGDVLKDFNPIEDKYISREFQAYGIYLSEELNDYKHKSLYIKLAKTVHRSILEKALSFSKDSRAKKKGALFMWKLKMLKEEGDKNSKI